tara:strand:- start:433 stop:687 length:255 start_codon:yes stop_codon:yes gene_type:complete
MINLIRDFPVTTVTNPRNLTEEKIKDIAYTKEQVDILIAAAVQEAVDEARRIDEESMAKHNRDATVIRYDIRIYHTCIICRWIT